jgi:hypothetical protein
MTARSRAHTNASTSSSKVAILVAITIAAIVLLWLQSPIPQDPSYHNFADTRSIAGIPNALNVASNLPFAIVGILGLASLVAVSLKETFVQKNERWAYIAFFTGVMLTSIGSSYYHLYPGNGTLVWDRLPMTLGFMGILAGVVTERLSPRLGKLLLLPLLALGAVSVWYWNLTEMAGAGDLRLYAFVQFYPLLVIPLLIWLFPARYSHTSTLIVAIGLYGVAKVFELLDSFIYKAGYLVSGHSLKHLVSAGAALCVLRWLKDRREVVA